MDPPFSDGGQPPSYTNVLLPGNAQQSSCVSEYSVMGHLQTLSPTVQEHSTHVSGVSSLPLESTLQHQSLPFYDSNVYAPITSNPQYLSGGHCQFWPSPPSGHGELDNYSYHSSPVLGNNRQFYDPSSNSPRTWYSPEDSFQQAVDALQIPLPQQDLPKNFRTCTPTSNNEHSLRSSQLSTPYMGGFQQSFKSEVDGLPHEESPTAMQDHSRDTPSYATSPGEPAAATPDLLAATEDDSPLSEPDDSPSPQRQLGTFDPHKASERPKPDEPYAQLIYKAFLSKPDYAMTLQEIYQWFREHTDKADGEGKGWQNSIRHNLSMNLAFVKRDKKENQGSDQTMADLSKIGDSKRSTEWILEDWAVRDGVQSTTRYRPKGNSSRRANAAGSSSKGFRHQSYPHGFYDGYPISTKSHSGRKTGPAVNKPTMQNRHYSQGSLMTPTSQQRNLPRGVYPSSRPVMSTLYSNNGENLLAPRSEPSSHPVMKTEPYNSTLPSGSATPASYNNLLMPEPSLGHDGLGGSIDGAHYALLGVGQGHLYVGSSSCEFPFGTADVTGVYQPEHHNAGPRGNCLFTDFPNGVYGWSSQGI